SSDILAILHHGVAGLQILERDLVTDRDALHRCKLQRAGRVVESGSPQSLSTFNLNYRNSHVVPIGVGEKSSHGAPSKKDIKTRDMLYMTSEYDLLSVCWKTVRVPRLPDILDRARFGSTVSI